MINLYQPHLHKTQWSPHFCFDNFLELKLYSFSQFFLISLCLFIALKEAATCGRKSMWQSGKMWKAPIVCVFSQCQSVCLAISDVINLAPLCVAKVLFSCLLLAESINIGQVGITLWPIFSLPWWQTYVSCVSYEQMCAPVQICQEENPSLQKRLNCSCDTRLSHRTISYRYYRVFCWWSLQNEKEWERYLIVKTVKLDFICSLLARSLKCKQSFCISYHEVLKNPVEVSQGW